MTISLKHAFVSPVADMGNPDEVGPDEWNAEHTLIQATGRLLGRSTAGAGATEEIAPDGTLSLSGGSLGVVSGDLTRVNDTNVTLTLGGTATGALLKAVSLTLGWSGTLAAARGGFGADISGSSGVPLFSTGVPTFTSTTGTGDVVRATSPSLVTPDLGTPSALTLTNATGLPTAGLVANAVSNAKLAQMSQATIKGRASGAGTGDPVDLTATQATALLDAMVGDSGSGGTKGLVPAPAAGDAAAGKFLKSDGSWTIPPGSSTTFASQATMEAASSTTEAVSPGRQKYHPGATKGWARWDASSGTPTIISSYNVSSISDNGTGTFAVNWTTSFSSTSYAAVGYVELVGNTNATGQWMQIDSLTTSAMNVVTTSVASATTQDRDYNVVVAFGDQ